MGTDSEAVEDVEVDVDVDLDQVSITIVEGNAELEGHNPLDLSVPAADPLAGYASKSFCMSWHCTNVTVSNSAVMAASHEAWIGAKATHTNDSINFYWARVEHHVYDYSNTHYVSTVSCTYNGEWAKKYYLPCTIVVKGLDGYTARTRLCADIKDDGKGTICTEPFAYAKAVW